MANFQYDPLDLSRREFRLVRLQKGARIPIICEIFHATLDDNVIPYEAVSYRWGSMLKTRVVNVRGAELSITRNLYFILYDLRHRAFDRYLWVDAICINQDNWYERGHQVQQMKDIYTGADRVLFCLARPSNSKYPGAVKVVMKSLIELQKLCSGRNWAPEDARWTTAWRLVQTRLMDRDPDLKFKQCQGLEYLLGQSWFRRAWILQEVANARSGLVYYGRLSVSAGVFAVAPRLIGTEPNPHSQASQISAK
ncbi:HET-domain-containing protein [Xylariaceae sp. FL0662B]|nr:HET-domain-containing protein [Xylariaceae sp. FL0662B]